MTYCGNHGKPSAGFPPFPQHLEIAFAISTFPPRRRGVEKWKPKPRVPTFPLVVSSSLSNQRLKPEPCFNGFGRRFLGAKLLPMSPV
jgi:hypothetical protein